MERAPAQPTAADYEAGDHLCGLFETEEEFRDLLIPFVRQGLERRERVLFLLDVRSPAQVLHGLRARGLGVGFAAHAGQLRFASARQVYLPEGDLDPDATLARLSAEADRAIEDGYTCLRACGEMSWFLRTELDAESLLAYESKLDAFFSDRRCVTLCLYDRLRFDPALLLQVVATHPIVAVGRAVYLNPNYVPPETTSAEGLSRAVLRQWLEALEVRAEVAVNLESLRRERNLLGRVMETTPAAVFLLDGEGRITYANRRVEEILGIDRGAITGAHVDDPGWPTMDFQGRPLADEEHPLRRALAGATVRDVPVAVGDAAGRRRLLKASAAPLVDGSGRVETVVVIAEDVTEAVAAEAALQKERDLTRSLVDTSPAFFVAIDGAGKVIMMNRAMLQAVGYSAEEVKGTDYVSTFIPEAERERLAATLRDLRLRRVPIVTDNPVCTRDGRELLVEWRGNVVVDRAGAFEYLFGLGIDVTARRRLEEQFRQAQKMEAIGRLAGGVAHDFNNLLTAILGYCELVLGRLGATDPLRREIEEVRGAGLRAAALTHQLLAFSRGQVLQPALLDLREVVREVQRMLERIVGEDVELVVRSGPEPCRVEADPGQLQQVIVNLAANARDAMPGGGRLTIETANVESEGARGHLEGIHPGAYVLLSVSDTGVGMDERTRAHLFEPFFTTKEMGKGTGLGLATVHGIVTQSGGRIDVQSLPGGGTTFRIYFPKAIEPFRTESVRPRHARPSGGTETILVVEDSHDVRALVCDVLRRQGYRVLEASRGDEALELSRRHGAIDLLLTDVVLPGMSGRVLAERLVACGSRLKVLYMSGYTDRGLAESPRLGTEVGFLQKPFQPEDLAREVRAILESG